MQPGKGTGCDIMLRTLPEMREEGVCQAEKEMKHILPTPKQMLQPLRCWIKKPLSLPHPLLFLWSQAFSLRETSTWKRNTSLTKWTDLPTLNKLNHLGFLWKIEPIFRTHHQNQPPLPLQRFSLAAQSSFHVAHLVPLFILPGIQINQSGHGLLLCTSQTPTNLHLFLWKEKQVLKHCG